MNTHDVLLSGTIIEDAKQWLESVDGHDITVGTPEALDLHAKLQTAYHECRSQRPIWGQTCAELALTGSECALLLNVIGRPS